jgi:succinoglycan biosynthesis transport protein ExoP
MSAADLRADEQRIDMGAVLGALLSRWLRILIVTLIALGATFAILLFVPKMYESTASLLVEQRANAASIVNGQQPATPSIPAEAMMSSQIELIRSRDLLLQVIDSENLRSESELTGVSFSPITFVMQLLGRKAEPRSVDETVVQNLNDRLSVVRERDSAVLSINVRAQNPELAARIANAIAEAHVRRRTAQSLSDTAEATVWLEQEIARLRIKVQESEQAVADYRVENDLFTGTENTPILDQQLTAISTQITTTQERKNAAQSRANLIRELLAQGKPIDGVQDVRNSVVIQQLSQTKATLQGELAERSATLLPNHPTIRSLTAQIDEIEDQIAGEARRVAEALEAEAEIEGNLESKLRDDLTRMKLSVSNATFSNVELESLEREAKAQRDLLESYLLKYSDASSRTDAGSALPDVRIITAAVPSVTPASPKTPLILGAVAFVVLALQVGGILFGELMSGRALTDRAYRPFEPGEDGEAYDERAAVADLFDEPEVPPEADAYADAQADVDGFVDVEPGATEPDLETAAEWAEFESAPPPSYSPPAQEPPRTAVAQAAAVAAAGAIPPTPTYMPPPARPTALDPTVGENALELSNLSADIAIGRVRVVMLAALTSSRDCATVAETLIGDALRRGLSIVRIDAGSGRPSTELGLTDLAMDRASFGDVVHRVREGLAEVPWGHQATLERRSTRPLTLIEALTDIYEVVVIETGRIGMASALPVFAGVPCRLVLVGPPHPAREMVEAAVEDAANLGYEIGQIVHPPELQVA